jgi:hypothetical protein
MEFSSAISWIGGWRLLRRWPRFGPPSPRGHLTQPIHIPRAENEAIRQLLLRYESVGHDCELGMVQKRYGAEPLGLFRWNSTRFDGLLAALDACLAGIGDPEFTDLWFSDGGEETYVIDKRWGLHMHTFMRPRDVRGVAHDWRAVVGEDAWEER